MSTTSKTTDLQAVAEVVADRLDGSPYVNRTTLVWNGGPAEGCAFTVTLNTSEKFDVTVTRSTPETEVTEHQV